jgi:hypothetical protein
MHSYLQETHGRAGTAVFREVVRPRADQTFAWDAEMLQEARNLHEEAHIRMDA